MTSTAFIKGLDNWNNRLDILLIVGVILTVIVIGLYINLVLKEKNFLKYPTIQFFNLRSAFIIPGFCIVNVLAICFANHVANGILEAFESLLEAYSIFNFFRMIEHYSLNRVVGVAHMIRSVPYHCIWNNDTIGCHKNHALLCYRSIRMNILIF